MIREDVLVGVRECLVSVLGVEGDEVTPEVTLVDLNMESIDVLDVIFSIEQKFGITTSMTELRSRLLGDLSEAEFFDDNRMVTDAGVQQLQKALPDFDLAQFGGEVDEEEIFSLFTVRHLLELIEEKLDQGSQEG